MGNDNNSGLIKKSSALININSSDLTTNQRKFMNTFLYFAKQQMKQNSSHKFKVSLSDFKNKSGITETNKPRLKKEIKDMQAKFVEYNITSKDKERWGVFPFLAGVDIVFNTETGRIDIEYGLAFQVLNHLENPNVYAYIDLGIVKGLNNKYSIALYEISRDYYKVKSKKFTIEKFRSLLGVGDKYSLFNMFEKRVLKPAVIDVNQKTEFTLSYSIHNTGRKKSHITLFMDLKQGEQLRLDDISQEKNIVISETRNTPSINQELFDNLLSHGINEDQIHEFTDDPKIGEQGIIYGFNYYEKNLKAGKIKDNHSGYLAKAIKNGWGKKSKQEKKEDENKENIKEARRIKLENDNLIKTLEKEYDDYLNKKSKKLIERLLVEELDEQISLFLDGATDTQKNLFRDKYSYGFISYIKNKFFSDESLENFSLSKNIDINKLNLEIVEATKTIGSVRS